LSAESLQRILEAQTHFGLPSPALVEKDLHVVAAIRALASIEAAPFTFVFGGGTSLARAHKTIQRMSEDIDFKIVPQPGNAELKGNALKRELSASCESLMVREGFSFEDSTLLFDWLVTGQIVDFNPATAVRGTGRSVLDERKSKAGRAVAPGRTGPAARGSLRRACYADLKAASEPIRPRWITAFS